jgi:hypothetical protein
MPGRALRSLGCALALASACTAVHAELAADQVARLGKDLTPIGAETAGNADGTIPAWEGGIKSPAEAGFPDFKSGGHHPDPFAGDKILFTITKDNMAQYADKLTDGQKALLNAYATYKLNVYPTRRSAAFPQYIYDKTREVAPAAKLAEGGNGVLNAINGFPFPIPKDGLEAIWNHILRFRAVHAFRNIGQAAVTRGGDYTMVKFADEFLGTYAMPNATVEGLDNVIIYFKQRVTEPARLAGEVLLVHETLDQALEHRRAWVYNPGQRRVRRAPNVAFDNPRTGSDGLMTSDQFDMYNGSPERYTWELLGKREIYVPYNSYKLHSNTVKYSEVLKPLHINPDLARYELHRVWVVDAKLKEGTRHLYKRRTFYFDEDSWQAIEVDQYDNRDQLWRVSEGHVINYYDVPNLWTTVEGHYDLQSGRYLAIGLNNEESKTYDFEAGAKLTLDDFSIGSLRQEGTR